MANINALCRCEEGAHLPSFFGGCPTTSYPKSKQSHPQSGDRFVAENAAHNAKRNTRTRINFRIRPWTLILFAAILSISSCSGGIIVPVTETPAPTDTPTVTIVWFPATETSTSLPSPTPYPTAEGAPGLGDPIIADTFETPEFWNTSTSSWASAAVTNNRLVLSINGQGPQSIISLRSEPTLGDFYAEATANVNLCRADDRYGMVFRAAPGENYYRLAINCNGQVRIERGRGGSVSPLTEWFPSGDVSFGAPASVKIGVWMVGSEMRLYLNDRFQFTVRDPILRTGTIGFFAYADGSTPVTVAFSDLQVYSVFYVSPTPSRTPTRTPTP